MRFSYRRHRLFAATGLFAALALTATSCDSSDESTGDRPGSVASRTADRDGDGIPDVLADKLEEHGVDVGDWRDGGWKDWNRDKWLTQAADFVNPVIEDLWSNLVWTAGHCVHAGSGGGWYRNIVFVPAYNDRNRSEEEPAGGAAAEEIAPFGQWWADWAATSDEWIAGGSDEGGAGAPYDYAVLHVRPESGDKSLEEMVGTALEVDFSAPSAAEAEAMGAWGYPAAPPYNGLTMFRCVDRPGRLSLDPSLPTMYRIGCTLTGGSSGGGWFRMVGADPRLVSNTSNGPADNTWLAGPRLGDRARALYDEMSSSYGGR